MNTRHPSLRRLAAATTLLAGLWALGSAQAGEISGSTEADRALAGKVHAAMLMQAPFLDPLTDVSIRADQGRVWLSGWVAHADHEPLARAIAARIDGVQAVSTQMRAWSSEPDFRIGLAAPDLLAEPTAAGPMSTGNPADQDLAAKVRASLLGTGAFDPKNTELMVQARDGRVSLSGWLGSAGDERVVRQSALAVPGVSRVDTWFRAWDSE